MMKIGITGGIGSGKSVVAELFRINGVPIYDADREAKRLNDSSPAIREKLTRQFGSDLYNGCKLDREKLARIIFSDPGKLQAANAIIHPELKKDFENWILQHSRHPLLGLETALLFEAKFGDAVDKIITVYAPSELRIARVRLRDNASEDSIRQRASHQLADEVKMKLSDFVICNDNRHSVIRQVEDLLKSFSLHL